MPCACKEPRRHCHVNTLVYPQQLLSAPLPLRRQPVPTQDPCCGTRVTRGGIVQGPPSRRCRWRPWCVSVARTADNIRRPAGRTYICARTAKHMRADRYGTRKGACELPTRLCWPATRQGASEVAAPPGTHRRTRQGRAVGRAAGRAARSRREERLTIKLALPDPRRACIRQLPRPPHVTRSSHG